MRSYEPHRIPDKMAQKNAIGKNIIWQCENPCVNPNPIII